jgi:biopolymer transport protein ExbD
MNKTGTNTYSTPGISLIPGNANQNKVLVTPVLEKNNTRICGKPWIGTAKNASSIEFVSVYSVSNTDTNTTYNEGSGLLTVAEREKLSLLSNGATKTAAINGSVSPNSPNAYVVGTIKVDDAIIDLYGKDTTYQVATISEAGLVKLGTDTRATGTLDSTNDWYPVTIDNNGKMYVNVPAQHKWKALYPNEKFQVTITNTSGDFKSIRLTLPSCILFSQTSYTSALATDTSVTTIMKYKASATNSLIDISADKKVIYAKAINYILIKAITEKGTIDVTLAIDVRNKNTSFYADII